MSETHQTTAVRNRPRRRPRQRRRLTPNGGAAPAPAFWEGFTDKGLAADQTVTKFKTAEEMARGYVNLEKRFGVPAERRIDLPEDMANAEAMRPVFAKLGLPDKPDGYGFKLAEGASEADNAMLGKYVEAAHKVGLPTAQARQMLDWWVEQNAAAQTAAARGADPAQERRRARAEDRLRQRLRRSDARGQQPADDATTRRARPG